MSTSSAATPLPPISQAMILDWMEQLRAESRQAPWHEFLDFDGVDAIDVLLSPIYLTLLNIVRKGPAPQEAPGKIAVSRLRDWGYRAKTALREHVAALWSAPARPTDVVLWSRDITHTIIQHPVTVALAQQGTRACALACHARAFEGLRARDPNAVYTMGLWPKRIRAAHRAGTKRAKQLAGYGEWRLPAFERPLVPGLHDPVRDTVIRFLPLVSEAVANAQAVFDVLRPSALVVGNDLTFEGRAACRIAAIREVPTAMFMHGSIAGDGMQAMHVANRILVNGPVHRQNLVECGVDPQRIVICGAPNLDQRPKQTGKTHPLLQARLGLRPGDPWILVATSGPGHRISHRHHEIVIANLIRLCKAFPTVPVVVKLHRKDRLEYYQQGLKDCADERLIVVAEDAYGFPRDIFEWLHGCRMVLTGASAVAVEAMLMDVPVVTMDFCNEVQAVDFIDAGATHHVCSAEALVVAVGQILSPSTPDVDLQARVDGYLREAFFALDGRSAERGAAALLDLININERHGSRTFAATTPVASPRQD